MHLKIHSEQVNDLSRILAEEKKQQPHWLQKSLKEKPLQSKYSRSIKMDFLGM